MIQFNNVTKVFPEGGGLLEMSISIRDGEFVFLVGPSGAGKTTFIRLLLKELEPDSGTILFNGEELTRLPRRRIPYYRRKMGVVFQDFRLLESLTVFENVAFAMEAVHKRKKLIRSQVPHILKLVGLYEKADRYPEELSGGEAQRAAIARAIVNDPEVLIADEPTGNLDPEKSLEIMNLLNQINLRGTTVVVVTHARDIVDKMGKRVVGLDGGRMVRDDLSGHYEKEGFSSVHPGREQKGNRRESVSFEEQVREQRYQQRLKQIRRKQEENAGQEVKGHH